jgi:hypothetical protein
VDTKLNPYAHHLGGRAAIDVVRSTPGELTRLWQVLDEGTGRSSAPGAWTAREILCHLADTEIVFAFRLRQALAEAHHVIQPMDQNRWAEQYAAYKAHEAFALFLAVRRWNLALVEHVMPAAAGRPLTHPERGVMTFQVLLETMAGHDLNHLRQLEGLGQSHPARR